MATFAQSAAFESMRNDFMRRKLTPGGSSMDLYRRQFSFKCGYKSSFLIICLNSDFTTMGRFNRDRFAHQRGKSFLAHRVAADHCEDHSMGRGAVSCVSNPAAGV